MDLLRDIYFTFYRENRGLYKVPSLTLISTPLRQISIPHFYGKIIDSLKTPDIDRALFFLYTTYYLGINSRYEHCSKLG